MSTYLLAINCGSSSIKAKLYAVSAKTEPLFLKASLNVTNINAKGERIKIKVKWRDGDDVEFDGEDGAELSEGGVNPDDIKYVTHRIVHGGMHKQGIRIAKEHTEGLAEMDKLSEFAPLHNHHAVLAVRSCLEALPNHKSLLLFDTLFHQTIPPETYTYALPPSTNSQMPLRKYGFHGLSYASIVRSIAQHIGKQEDQVNIVVAHLGSGASACCIRNGKSIDTSMGLTPLEGLIGGTRAGTIDPTAIFHHTADAASVTDGITKAEMIMNKQSGLLALAGTTDFGAILASEQHQLAYNVYLDRLLGYISQYLCKLLSHLPLDQIDGLVFSGGIGEKAGRLRSDVLKHFSWLGAEIGTDDEGAVVEITTKASKLRGWVVQTDEEGWCAHLARKDFDI